MIAFEKDILIQRLAGGYKEPIHYEFDKFDKSCDRSKSDGTVFR